MASEKVYRAIGLMSGTSLDGLDAALVETDGRSFVRPIAALSESYDDYAPDLRTHLRQCLGKSSDEDGMVAASERDFTLYVAQVVKDLLKREGLKAQDIDYLGFHGQTIFHDPEHGFTWQIGDGALLARESGIDVVCDFRSADMKNAGQGAPLLPLYHHMLVNETDVMQPCLVLNLGGVSNLTLVQGAPEDLIAFDCGPGNALMDDVMKARLGQGFDEGGRLAASGRVDEMFLDAWMAHPYFRAAYPKSLDRDPWDVSALAALSLEDALASLAEFTVRGVKAGVDLLPARPAQVIVCGGGRYNAHVMARLQSVLGVPVALADDFGWAGDFVEAQGFALFAVRSVLGLPVTFPGTTGCLSATVGGVMHPAV